MKQPAEVFQEPHSCRRWREREAIFALDEGAAPPLSPLGPGGTWGRLHSTEWLAASPLLAWKATAVQFLLLFFSLSEKELRDDGKL